MEKYEIEKLHNLDIEEVAERLGMEVNRVHKALCPFHDDHHASLSFNRRKNTCRCFVCMEKSMDTIGLVMKVMHVDFIVATRWLAERFGVSIEDRRVKKSIFPKNTDFKSRDSRDFKSRDSRDAAAAEKKVEFDAARYARFFEHPWLSDEARRFLFEERKIDPRVVRWCRISSWCDHEGTHWLQTPYFDVGGRLIGIQNRNLDYVKGHTDLTDLTDSLGESGVNTNLENSSGEKTSVRSVESVCENSPQEKNSVRSVESVCENSPQEKNSVRSVKSVCVNSSGEKNSVRSVKSVCENSSGEKKSVRSVESVCENSSGEKTSVRSVESVCENSSGEKKSVRSVRSVCENSPQEKASVRSVESVDEKKPRFRFPYGAKCGIYNLPVINRLHPGDELYITEGCSDCWAMLSAGHKAIAIPSATLLTPEDKLLLRELSARLSIQWHMFPDRDAPGERLFLQLKEILPSIQHHQLPLGCKDFGDYWKSKFKDQ